MAMFSPEFRSVLSRIPIQRVPSIAPYEYRGRRVEPAGTYDESPSGPGRIRIRQDAQDYAGLLLEELLHAAHSEYEPFAQDKRRNFQSLWDMLYGVYGGRVPDQLAQDPPHAFTGIGAQSLTNAPNVPLDLYRYFLPLRQGVLTD